MYFCKNCGAQLEDTAMFCASCGAKRETEEMEVPVMGETVTAAASNTGFGTLFGGACKHVMFLVAAILTSTFVLINFFAQIAAWDMDGVIGVLEMMVTGGLVVTAVWLMYAAGLKRKPNASYMTSLKLIRAFWLIQLIWTGITLLFNLIAWVLGFAGAPYYGLLWRILEFFDLDYYWYLSEQGLILQMFNLLISAAATIVYIVFSFQMLQGLTDNLESDAVQPIANGKKWAIMLFVYVGIHFLIGFINAIAYYELVGARMMGSLFLTLINSGAMVLYGVQMLLLESKIAANR